MKILNTQQAAALLGITRRRVVALLKAGRIPGARKLGRDWIIPEDSLAAVAVRPTGIAIYGPRRRTKP